MWNNKTRNGGCTSSARRQASLFNYTQLLWIMWSHFFLRESLVCSYPNRNPLMLMGCTGSEAAKANCWNANKKRLICPTTAHHLQTLPSKTLSLGCAVPSVMQPGGQAGLLTQRLGGKGWDNPPPLLQGWWQPYTSPSVITWTAAGIIVTSYIGEFFLIVVHIISHSTAYLSVLAFCWQEKEIAVWW